MNAFAARRLIGTWRCPAPWAADYLAEYTISMHNGKLMVSARELADGEEFVISDVSWDGTVLSFRSVMLSTGCDGFNEFSFLPDGQLQLRFTFTVFEALQRVGA